MHTTAPFTVGIIQDSASDDAAATVAASVERIREAAARGAQIICLKELFNAPYFCKSQKCERFDLAEPIPGPTTDTMQALAKELGVVLVVPIFEKQARGVYRNSAAIIDAITAVGHAQRRDLRNESETIDFLRRGGGRSGTTDARNPLLNGNQSTEVRREINTARSPALRHVCDLPPEVEERRN